MFDIVSVIMTDEVEWCEYGPTSGMGVVTNRTPTYTKPLEEALPSHYTRTICNPENSRLSAQQRATNPCLNANRFTDHSLEYPKVQSESFKRAQHHVHNQYSGNVRHTDNCLQYREFAATAENTFRCLRRVLSSKKPQSCCNNPRSLYPENKRQSS
jgi:hypothetical protein